MSTAEPGWLAWAEACTQSYAAAYAKHAGALSAAKIAQTARDEDKLKLFNIMLAIAGASWVPRLLKPIASNAGEAFGYDELTTGWVKDALRSSGDERLKVMKGTALAELKRFSGSTYDAFDPVVDTTINYSSRLKEGIYKRAEALLRKMDDVIAEASLYTMLEASQRQNDFFIGCPFLKGLRRDIGDGFKAKFQNDSALAMWFNGRSGPTKRTGGKLRPAVSGTPTPLTSATSPLALRMRRDKLVSTPETAP